MQKYHCERCGYATNKKDNFRTHCNKIKICDALLADVEVNFDEFIKKQETITSYICPFCTRYYSSSSSLSHHKKICTQQLESRVPVSVINNNNTTINITNNNSSSDDNLKKRIQELERQVQRILQQNRNEAYYQNIIERYLGNTHENLCIGDALMGTTDISTPTLHAEIKSWKKWKHAMGQLMAYDACDSRTHCHAYLFGRYDEDHKKAATDIMKKYRISVFDCLDNENGVEIIEYETENTVYIYDNDIDLGDEA
jgi:hypothetical protein